MIISAISFRRQFLSSKVKNLTLFLFNFCWLLRLVFLDSHICLLKWGDRMGEKQNPAMKNTWGISKYHCEVHVSLKRIVLYLYFFYDLVLVFGGCENKNAFISISLATCLIGLELCWCLCQLKILLITLTVLSSYYPGSFLSLPDFSKDSSILWIHVFTALISWNKIFTLKAMLNN